MLRRYITSALLGIKSARLRSVLTVLGISMGIFLVVILLAIAKGAQHDIISRITDLGANTITVQSANKNISDRQADSPVSLVKKISIPSLTLDDLATTQKQNHIVAAAPVTFLEGALDYKKNTIAPIAIIATSPNYTQIQNISLASGHFVESQGNETSQLVLGSSIKTQLFGESNAIGQYVNYGKQKTKVVGVLTQGQLNSQLDRVVFVSPDVITDPARTNVYSEILAKVDSVDKVNGVIASLTKSFLAYSDRSSFSVSSSRDLVDASKNVLNVLTALVSLLGVISLAMGGIGIMNMMVVAVTDRTKEIGVRKTVGASAANIFWQFLLESILLTVVGGGIGLCVAQIAVMAIKRYMPLDPLLNGPLILLGLSISVLVGVIFGVGPALHAARKEPIEALQTDHS